MDYEGEGYQPSRADTIDKILTHGPDSPIFHGWPLLMQGIGGLDLNDPSLELI